MHIWDIQVQGILKDEQKPEIIVSRMISMSHTEASSFRIEVYKDSL
jgi:hypothetical protein